MELAPEFLNSIIAQGDKILSWAQSVTDELVREMHVASASKKTEALKIKIDQFIVTLREKRKELREMDHRIRRVYDQIRPSPGYGGITRAQISEEKFSALGILSTFTKNLESILFGWESILYLVEKSHVSWEEAYAANSSKLTIPVTSEFTARVIAPVRSIAPKRDSIEQTDGISPSNSTSQVDWETKGESLSNRVVHSDKVILKSATFLGISKGQWVLITALGMGVGILYCVLFLLVLKVFLF